MATLGIAVAQPDQSTAERYEALIRIANSIRAQKDPRELFGTLVHELGRVIQLDAIAQFDEASNKVDWHLGVGCHKPEHSPSEIDREETIAAWVFRCQEIVAIGSLETETRFPYSVRIMRQAGIQSVCAFPLTTAHRRLGSLVIASIHRDAYTEDE